MFFSCSVRQGRHDRSQRRPEPGQISAIRWLDVTGGSSSQTCVCAEKRIGEVRERQHLPKARECLFLRHVRIRYVRRMHLLRRLDYLRTDRAAQPVRTVCMEYVRACPTISVSSANCLPGLLSPLSVSSSFEPQPTPIDPRAWRTAIQSAMTLLILPPTNPRPEPVQRDQQHSRQLCCPDLMPLAEHAGEKACGRAARGACPRNCNVMTTPTLVTPQKLVSSRRLHPCSASC